MFADESDEVCPLCYHLSSTFTEGVGRITASDQTVQAVHSCISWFLFLMYTNIRMPIKNFQYQNNQCKPFLVWSSPGALAEDAGSCRLWTVRDSLCGRGMMFGHWFPPHVSAPQSPFYHDPNPVWVLCSTYGNLRVFEYTI